MPRVAVQPSSAILADRESGTGIRTSVDGCRSARWLVAVAASGVLAACSGDDSAGALPDGATASRTSAGAGAGGTAGVVSQAGGSNTLGGASAGSGGASTLVGGAGMSGASVGGAAAPGGAGGVASLGGAGGNLSQSGGSGGSAGAGGSGGAAGYTPCPTDGSPCLVLPFGDSITYGVGSTDKGGYRAQLFKLVVQANQKIKFIGSLSDGPDQVAGTAFPKTHEGHSGWTIDSGYVSFGDGISTLIPTPAFKTLPHIVLLMIGTNDVGASKGTDMVANRLDTLLEKIVQTAPKALVVVAQITPIGWNPPAASNYNAKIPGIVRARVSKGQHLAVVDMSKMPTSDLGSDNLHPNDTGYVFMAGVWYAAIKDYLPK